MAGARRGRILTRARAVLCCASGSADSFLRSTDHLMFVPLARLVIGNSVPPLQSSEREGFVNRAVTKIDSERTQCVGRVGKENSILAEVRLRTVYI